MKRAIKYLSSGNPIFDGSEAVVWVMDMVSNVGAAQIKNIAPGVLYTFVFRQSAKGGHRFAWPANVLNAPELDTSPNAITTQNLVAYTGGLLFANLPATWSEKG